jgi:hypothetical protein
MVISPSHSNDIILNRMSVDIVWIGFHGCCVHDKSEGLDGLFNG